MPKDTPEEKGLPVNLEAERFVLGSILMDGSTYTQCAGALGGDDFSLESHRRLFRRMGDISERGDTIDRVTLANELIRYGELESVGGLGYMVSLDDGLPHIYNLPAYVKIVKEKATARGLIFAAQHVINTAMVGETSVAEQVVQAQETFLAIQARQTDERFFSPLEVVQGYEGGINAFLDPSSRARGLSTGFPRFDEMTGGLRTKELTVLAARPGVGKSALSMNIASHVAKRHSENGAVAVISMEMSKESLLERVLCAEARVDSRRFRLGYIGEEERHRLRIALNDIVQWPLHISDRTGNTLPGILTELKRLKSEHGLSLAIIDYLQLMTVPKAENRNLAIGAITRGLKLATSEMEIPILLLSQLSRAPDQRKGSYRPMLSDLRESGNIENDADNVLFIFREELYRPDREDLKGHAELIIGKQRQGPVGIINLVFLGHLTKFENRCEDIPDEAQGAEA